MKGLSLNPWGQHPRSVIHFSSDSAGKLFYTFCCHFTSQLLKSICSSPGLCHAIVIAGGFINAVYTFKQFFPLGEEISRYKQDKQLEASCVLRDGPYCFSTLKCTKCRNPMGDCHHLKSLHHGILKNTG